MKSFNLEEAKKNRPIEDSFGYEYQFVGYVPNAEKYYQVVLFNKKERLYRYCNESGEDIYGVLYGHPFIKKTYYSCLYYRKGEVWTGTWHLSEEMARKYSDCKDVLKIISAEIET